MISWHKPGQKVACISVGQVAWNVHDLEVVSPVVGSIYTVLHVVDAQWLEPARVGFVLVELPDYAWFSAGMFRPVYPTIIDQLRKLCAPSPERVKEDA